MQLRPILSSIDNPDDVDVEIELRLARFEGLMERRPKLLNSVLLRQNPHNCAEWLKRVDLMKTPREVIDTYTEALKTVSPDKAVGKLSEIWVRFAKFYEKAHQLDDARAILNRATSVHYKSVDELADCWCQWAELELRNDKPENAMNVIRKATQKKKNVGIHDKLASPQERLFRSLKTWLMLADLEESYGTFESCKRVYEQVLDLRIATPQTILNYTAFLAENKYFEDSFRVFERGVGLFKWPNVCEIWQTYLTKFVKRYGGSQLERARDLFEQCLEGAPEKYCKEIYLLYAKLEEDHGLIRSAMQIYDRAVHKCPKEEKYQCYNIYLNRASHFHGVTAKRPIFHQAINDLDDDGALKMAVRYAALEKSLGEIDRARGIFAFASTVANPDKEKDFWATWKEFEGEYGNEDTIREMFRLKRSTQALFTSDVNFHKAQRLLAEQQQTIEEDLEHEKDKLSNVDKKALLEQVRDGRVKGTTSESAVEKMRQKILFTSGKNKNPDEINLDAGANLDGSDDEGGAMKMDIGKQMVPDAIYGGLKKD